MCKSTNERKLTPRPLSPDRSPDRVGAGTGQAPTRVGAQTRNAKEDWILGIGEWGLGRKVKGGWVLSEATSEMSLPRLRP